MEFAEDNNLGWKHKQVEYHGSFLIGNDLFTKNRQNTSHKKKKNQTSQNKAS